MTTETTGSFPTVRLHFSAVLDHKNIEEKNVGSVTMENVFFQISRNMSHYGNQETVCTYTETTVLPN